MHDYDHDLAEHVIMINDWIRETAVAKFANHFHGDANEHADFILINGKGVGRNYVDSISGRVYETPRAEFRVRHGQRYRFRLINSGFLDCPIEFSIDEHNLTIIASDGSFVQPLQVESLIIFAGI